ncbi:hypothetical protein B0O99DRAFT_98530 [Bisporella sp. PMI_857]|nr:hypothetical protein B0O99DRAFT_98530 [Bisporella sp. PMI_857]
MAPKKGGGGSSSSSSGGGSGGISCPACTEKIRLWGDDWKNKKTNALFAFEIIAIIVLLACLVAATRFKWVRQAGRDRLRSIGYVIATISAIVYLAFMVSNTGLSESETTTTNLYYLTNIFSSLAWRLSDLIILGVILRTVAEMSNLTRRLPAFHTFYIVILSVLSAISFGIYVYQTVKIIRFGQEYAYEYYADGYNLQRVRRRVDLAYQSLFFAVAIYVNVMAVFALLRDRSKVRTPPL